MNLTLLQWLYHPDTPLAVSPDTTLIYDEGRFILATPTSRILLAPHEQSLDGLTRLLRRWPVLSGATS